jgi:putative tryptophan/tyrosine transport system substrate-binding protein
MRRRDCITLLAGAMTAWPLASRAQQKTMPVLGWLSPATTQSYQQPGTDSPGPAQLRAALAKHGLVEGTDIRVEMRLAEGKIDRLPALAKELVDSGASVLLAMGEPAGKAGQAATATVPIVCVADDLVDSGMADSLAKPGSNITGVSILATELDAKKLQVLKELLPDAKRFGVLNDPTTSGPDRPSAMAEMAQRLGVALSIADVHDPDDLPSAFAAFEQAQVQGINVVASAMLNASRTRIGELSLAAKFPAICQFRLSVIETGCLASYGITIPELYDLSVSQIAKILRGRKPEDLPVQQPTKFELVVSLKNAKALGLTVPQAILARADEVIE